MVNMGVPTCVKRPEMCLEPVEKVIGVPSLDVTTKLDPGVMFRTYTEKSVLTGKLTDEVDKSRNSKAPTPLMRISPLGAVFIAHLSTIPVVV